MSKNTVEWRPIFGYDGYEVSSTGVVRSVDRFITRKNGCRYRMSGKEISRYTDSKGYYYVILHKEGSSYKKLVHRLVATAFLENQENKPCVDHIDTIRTNNAVSNLRWVSYQENALNELTRTHQSDAKKEWWKDESRRKWMSESKLGENNPNYGKHYTYEEKEIISKKHSKPVYQYTFDRKLVNQYKSVKEAAEANGYDSGNISRACRGIYNQYKNSVWSYERL